MKFKNIKLKLKLKLTYKFDEMSVKIVPLITIARSSLTSIVNYRVLGPTVHFQSDRDFVVFRLCGACVLVFYFFMVYKRNKGFPCQYGTYMTHGIQKK